jgi:hypothetical protein
MIRSLGLRAAMFNGSGAGALGLLGSLGCEELEVCAVLEACGELEVCVELWLEFGPLPVELPGSGAGG